MAVCRMPEEKRCLFVRMILYLKLKYSLNIYSLKTQETWIYGYQNQTEWAENYFLTFGYTKYIMLLLLLLIFIICIIRSGVGWVKDNC